MPKHGKKHRKALEAVEPLKRYSVAEAIEIIKKVAYAKFDESLNIDIRLGVDPRHADQQVRGTVVLPHGTGKKIRVAVFAEGEQLEEAKAAGAEVYGGADLVTKIRDENFLDFDIAIATPAMMREVGKIGKMLGPRGLMPNPKAGTVTMKVGEAVREAKAGKVEFRLDRTANVHNALGRVSFDAQKLVENTEAFLEAVKKAKPSASKGIYFRSVWLSSTMGPGLRIDFGGL